MLHPYMLPIAKDSQLSYFPEAEAAGKSEVVEPEKAPKMHTSDPVFKVDEVVLSTVPPKTAVSVA